MVDLSFSACGTVKAFIISFLIIIFGIYKTRILMISNQKHILQPAKQQQQKEFFLYYIYLEKIWLCVLFFIKKVCKNNENKKIFNLNSVIVNNYLGIVCDQESLLNVLINNSRK